MTPQAQAQAMIILMKDLIDLTQSDFQEITSSLIPPDSHISPRAVALGTCSTILGGCSVLIPYDTLYQSLRRLIPEKI